MGAAPVLHVLMEMTVLGKISRFFDATLAET